MKRVVVLCACLAFLWAAAPAAAQSLGPTCEGVSPSASTCIGFAKLAERLSAECRRVGRPASECRMPLGTEVADDIVAAYRGSWLHRTAEFQYRLADGVPFRDAPWLGTHNSFNSANDEPTLSKTDSNQQLSLTDQLESDIRSMELDLHWAPNLHAGAANAVLVCHGRGADEQDFGCTNERPFRDALAPIAAWLRAHPQQVLLLYLEDDMDEAPSYPEAVRVLDDVLKQADGRSMIYRPSKSNFTEKGCADLPLDLSRNGVRARGSQVVLVGNCRAGWAADVFGWDDVHVESGSTPGYRAYPACDATYKPDVYAEKMVRYYEDSTFVSAAVDPTWKPEEANADKLNPNRVMAMTRCGVNLFGFDQFLPNDGRILASIWSWATDRPKRSLGRCAIMLSDGRWSTRPCDERHLVACRMPDGWLVTKYRHTWERGREACGARGGKLGLPRTAPANGVLRENARPQLLWLDYRLP